MSARRVALEFTKAHAYGNDFLFVPDEAAAGREAAGLARSLCDRHTGIGADGLILYRATAGGAAMRLFNADGSVAEVSGNGVRCLAAIVVENEGVPAGADAVIETEAGIKRLTLLEAASPRYTFRADMGRPTDIRRVTVDVEGEAVPVVALSVGNPQCIVLVDRLDEDRFRWLASRLATHPMFPQGTNVELVEAESRDRVRILIWERGVGPTTASGTGACASAVAAAFDGRTGRSLDVVSRGGTQHVDWKDDGLRLTGWAEIVARGKWLL